MKNWKQNRNYRKHKNTDGTMTYIITIDGVNIEVDAEIYREYASLDRKMEYMERDLKCNRVLQDVNGRAVRDRYGLSVELPELEISLDKLIDENWDFPSSILSPEEAFFSKDTDEAKLRRCITLLSNDEQTMIKALFFERLTEKAYGKILGIKQQSVNERKRRIFKKIKSLWG